MKDSFSIVSEAFGGVGLDAYELSIYVVEDILTHIWVQIIAVLFLVVVSILGTRCYFYADKMVYKQGKIFQKERSVGFSRIKNISYDKYINWFNFGSITLLVQDEVLRAIKVDYVNNLETEYKKIKELVEGKKQQSEDSNKV
ncbi:hypothetical protein HQ529_05685 [Candidatus Woesearchaeota archaeon]|nr:hypothetical protein [Candidatus Woesearchaeota archaeon]